MRVGQIIWLPEIEDKLYHKHHVLIEEVEDILFDRPHIRLWREGTDKVKTCMQHLDKPQMGVG
jgi:hypothetical protein